MSTNGPRGEHTVVAVTLRDAIDEAVRRLEGAAIPDARRNAEWMLSEVLGRGRAYLYAHPGETLSEQQIRRWEKMIVRRLEHEPLQYVVGQTEFYGLRIEVTPAVLIPRPETEQVVEAALRLMREVDDPRVLDVGTGSGCIAIAVKTERTDAFVTACDVSRAALEVARRNAEAHHAEVLLFEADLLSNAFASSAPVELDLLISNPPYVAEEEAATLPREVFAYEPHEALFAPGDPILFYRRLAEVGGRLLRPGGWLVAETHAEYGREARRLLEGAGFEEVTLLEDYAGRPRILTGRRRLASLAGRAGSS